MQNLWKMKLSWDETRLGSDHFNEKVGLGSNEEFWSWVDQLNLLSTMKIPRCYQNGLPNEIANQQLHLFCDASTKSYGAVGYLRSEDEGGNVIISIVLSKVRVAPVKQITLLRLEIFGRPFSSEISLCHEDRVGDRTSRNIVLDGLASFSRLDQGRAK